MRALITLAASTDRFPFGTDGWAASRADVRVLLQRMYPLLNLKWPMVLINWWTVPMGWLARIAVGEKWSVSKEGP